MKPGPSLNVERRLPSLHNAMKSVAVPEVAGIEWCATRHEVRAGGNLKCHTLLFFALWTLMVWERL